jgi:hypothetical protein
METYVPDPELYTPRIKGYTSESEFILAERVQITNEIPTADAFESLHHIMQNDLWKWFVGWTSLTFDVPYNMETNGWEYFDEDGVITEVSTAKYVNGIRVKDYGPIPDEINGELRVPSFRRYEVNGSLLPEFDLLLHEGYRYLEKLYPDHPDWVELLTKNEIDDEIVDAAAPYDYVPNVAIFDLITENLVYDKGLSESNLIIAKEHESLMMKIRNITNNTFRRKFYGSKIGYWMFGADAYQQLNVYMIGKYIPYQGILDPSNDHSLDNPSFPTFDENGQFFSRDTQWFSEIEKQHGFEDRTINLFNRNYMRPFKMLDWNNQTYDYHVPKPAQIYGTGFSVPYDPYSVYEYRKEGDSLIPIKFTNFIIGQKISINNEDPTYIHAISQNIGYETRLTIDDPPIISNYPITGYVSKMEVLTIQKPRYAMMWICDGIEDTLKRLINSQIDVSDYIEALPDFSKSAHILLSKSWRGTQHKFTMNPERDGAFIMPYDKLIKMYEDSPGWTVERNDSEYANPNGGHLVYTPDIINEEFEIKPGQLLSMDQVTLTSSDFISSVTSITKGQVQVEEINGPGLLPSQKAMIEDLNRTLDSKSYGLVINWGGDKKTILFGKPEIDLTGPYDDDLFKATRLRFYITAIPKIKSRWMMEAVHNSYHDQSILKARDLIYIIGSSDDFPKGHIYKVCQTAVSSLEKEWDTVHTCIDQMLIKAADPSSDFTDKDELFKELDTDWKAFNKTFNSVQQKYLTATRTEWKSLIKSSLKTNRQAFIEVTTKFRDTLQSYVQTAVEDFLFMLSDSLIRDYYENIDPKLLPAVKQEKLLEVKGIDQRINTYLGNRYYMLDPMPSKFWIPDPVISEDCEVSIEELKTKFGGIIRATVSPIFEEYVAYEFMSEVGNFGILSNYICGFINTVLLVDGGRTVNTINGYFGIPLVTPVGIYEEGIYTNPIDNKKYPWVDFRSDIRNSMALLPTRMPGISRTEGSFLEKLPIIQRNNIIGDEQSRDDLSLMGTVDIESNRYAIKITDDFSYQRMLTLNTGDELYESEIASIDTLIEKVDFNERVITTSKPLLQSGEFKIKFKISMNVAPDEITDYWHYRSLLDLRDLLDDGNPFRHGLYGSDTWPDGVSSVVFNSPIDSRYYKEDLVDELEDNVSFRDSFNEIVATSYQKNKDDYVLPSMINETGEIFLEAQPTRVINGKLSDVKLLDYFENNLRAIGRAGDFVNVGINLVLQTDNSNNYTPFITHNYTDESIQLRFRTLEWNSNSLPVYIEVGRGNLDRLWKDTQDDTGDVVEIDTSSDRIYWDDGTPGETRGSMYDEPPNWKDETVDDDEYTNEPLNSVGIHLDGDDVDRGVYPGEDMADIVPKDYDELGIFHVYDPIFEVPIGEYEIKRHVFPISGGDTDTEYTLITSTIIKQEFKDLKATDQITMNYDKTFDMGVIQNLSSGLFKDKMDPSNPINLVMSSFPSQYSFTTIKSDIYPIKFEGEWTPASRFNRAALAQDTQTYGVYELNWPPAPLEDGRRHYYITTNTVTVNSVYDSRDNWSSPKDHLFNKMTVIFWEFGKWNEYEFVFGGIYGSSAALEATFEPISENKVPINSDLGNTYGPGRNDDGKSEAPAVYTVSDYGNWTIKHRLLTKIIGQTGALRGNVSYLRSFTVEDLGEIIRWFNADLTDANVGDWTEATYGIRFNTIEDLVQSSEILKGGDNRNILPKKFVLEDDFKIRLDRIYWFIIGPASTTNKNWKSMLNVGFKAGDMTCIVYNKASNDWGIYSVNSDSKWSYFLDTTHLSGMSYGEWLTFTGLNANTYELDGSYWLPIDRKNNIFTEIPLSRSRILQGSFSLDLRLDPEFSTTCWLWDEYLEYLAGKKQLKNVSVYEKVVTEQPIYVDEERKLIFTYSEGLKYVIKMKENRFFKNALFVTGNYQLEEVEEEGTIVLRPRIRMLPGISFDIDNLTTLDRLLQINEIRVRSPYSQNLEPTFYSSYVNVTGVVRGIYVGNIDSDLLPNLFLDVGFNDVAGQLRITERINSATEFRKLSPVRTQSNGTVAELSQNQVDFLTLKWAGDIDLIPKPLITEFDIRRDLSYRNDALDFQYYQNTLILEGMLNTANPSRISFENNELLGDALDKVLTGCKVLSILSLDYSKYSGADQYNFIGTRFIKKVGTAYQVSTISIPYSVEIVRNDYAEGLFIGASNSGQVLVYEIDSLLALTTNLKCTIIDFGLQTGMTLTGTQWNTETKKWRFSYSSNTGGVSKFIDMKYDIITKEVEFEESLLNSGIDIDTYQIIDVLDVNSGWNDTMTIVDQNQYMKIYARDMAFLKIQNHRDETKAINLSGQSVTTDPNTSKRAYKIGPGVYESDSQIGVASTTYKEVQFQTYQVNNSAGEITVGLFKNDKSLEYPKVYTFDRTLDLWVESEAYDSVNSLVPFISGRKSKEITGMKTYIVGKDFAESNDLKLPKAAKPPLAPQGIPTPVLDELEIIDPDESRDYPPPRVPYGVWNQQLTKSHPFVKWWRDNSTSISAKIPATSGFRNNTYRVMEDIISDNISLPGKKTYNSKIDPNNKKGSVVNFSIDTIKFYEAYWFCLTNPGAPDKNLTDEYGLKIYVEAPIARADKEVFYVYHEAKNSDGSRIPNKVTGDGYLPSLPPITFDTPPNSYDDTCDQKRSFERVPPWKHITIPNEYINTYVYRDVDTTYGITADMIGLPSPERFWQEYFVYTTAYDKYINEYNSYIAGQEFKDYINVLRQNWRYLGEAATRFVVTKDKFGTIANPTALSIISTEGSMGYGFMALPFLKTVPMFLNKLPSPYSTDFSEVAAVVLDSNSYKLKVRVTGSGSSFYFIDPRVESSMIVDQQINPLTIFDELTRTREEGIYDPYSQGSQGSVPLTDAQKNSKKSTKFAVWNQAGYQAVVIGDQVFFYSPTRCFDIVDENNTRIYSEKTSNKFHWKRATLPSKRHTEYMFLSQMDLKDAISYVVQIRRQFLTLIDTLLQGASGDAATGMRAVKDWIEKNPVIGYDDHLNTYDLLKNNSGIKYDDISQIPTVLTIPGITFEETESGVIPIFGSGYSHTFTSRGDDGTGLLNKDNYYQYLNHYSTYIIGQTRFTDYINNGIKEVYMTETVFGIITKNDDIITLPLYFTSCRNEIEKYQNWSISQIDPQYVLSTKTGLTTEEFHFRVGNTSYTIAAWPTEVTEKGFKINQVFAKNDMVVIAGYVQANDTIKAMAENLTSYSIINELYPNDSWRYFPDRKYPVVFYSNDSGKSFQKCKLPPEQFIPNIKSYNGEIVDVMGNITPATENSNIEAFSIHQTGNELRVWFKNPDEKMMDPSDISGIEELNYIPLGFTTFQIVDSELQWLENISLVEKKSQSQLLMLRQLNNNDESVTMADYKALVPPPEGEGAYSDDDINELKLSKTRTTTYREQSIISPIGGIKVMIQQPFLYKNNNIEITRIEDTIINVTEPESTAANWKAEDVRVLVSIIPNILVSDQGKYLAPKIEYLNWRGDFIVPEQIAVEDPSLANKLYSYRETLQIRAPGQTTPSQEIPREMTPKIGIPAFSEDLERLVYEYMDPYTNADGVEVYDPEYLKNLNNEYVILCDKAGHILIERDSYKPINSMRLYDLILNGINAQTMARAIMIKPNYDVTIIDSKFNSFLNGDRLEYKDENTGQDAVLYNPEMKLKQQVRLIDYEVSNPKVLIDSQYATEILTFMKNEGMLYIWPTNSDGTPRTDVSSSDPTTGSVAYDWDNDPWADYWRLIHHIQETEGEFGSPQNITNRLDRFTYHKCPDNQYSIYDKTNKLIVAKIQDRISMGCNVSYTCRAGLQRYSNIPFNFNNQNQLITPNESFPVTLVNLNPLGYGGTINTKDWNIEHPWNIDVEAFEDELVKSSRNDDIYLADTSGNKLNVNNGYFWVNKPDQVLIRYEDLFKDIQEVRIKPEGDYDWMSYFIYKVNPTQVDFWIPKNEIYLNGDQYSDSNGIRFVDCTMIQITRYGLPVSITDTYDDGSAKYNLEVLDDDGKTRTDVRIVQREWPPVNVYKTESDGSLTLSGVIINKSDYIQFLAPIEDFSNLSSLHRFPNDKVTFRITDRNGLVSKKTFNIVQPYSSNKESGRVMRMSPMGYTKNNELVTDELSIEVIFDHRTLQQGDLIISNDNAMNIVYGNIVDRNPGIHQSDTLPYQWKVTMTCSKRPTVEFFNILRGDILFNIDLNIRSCEDVNLFYNRNWYRDDIERDLIIYTTRIFCGDIELTDKFSIEIQGDSIKYYYNDNQKILLLEKKQTPYYSSFGTFIFNIGETYTFTPIPQNAIPGQTIPERAIIDGLRGPILLKKPIFSSFKTLLDKKRQVINLPASIIEKYEGQEFNNINSIPDDLSYIELKETIKKPEWNDGSPHEVRIKFLTTESQQLRAVNMNDESYIEEVFLNEIDVYGYDRIYFDPDGYPQSPVRVNGKWYFTENSEMFEPSSKVFLNPSGFKVMQCDINGKYIEFILDNKEPVMRVLGDSLGDLRADVHGQIDKRVNPRRLTYTSTYDWFKNSYYVSTSPSNPYWQWIHIKDEYDSIVKKWSQKTSISRTEKAVDILRDVYVPSSEVYTFIEKSVNYETTTELIKNNINDFIDYSAGVIKFILGHPSSKYYEQKTIIKYGIFVTNNYYPGMKNMNVWKNRIKGKVLETFNYTVNSLENFSNVGDRDGAIAKITEVGLFNNDHKMIAYAAFPPIEYRSDSQHLSFTFLIRNREFPVMN